VSNTQQTVPAGKVWKVTSTYGTTLFCDDAINSNGYWGGTGTKLVFLTNSFLVSRTRMFSFNEFAGGKYQSCAYSGVTPITGSSLTNCPASAKNQGFPDIAANPNILPIWLPAGTTVQTSANTVFLSVLEFDVVN
jgi:hypothetical protein